MREVVLQNAHAWNRSTARSCFQLPFAGAAGAQGSSAATNSRHGRADSETAFAAVRRDVRESGPSFDSAGAVAACAAVADVVFGAQRATAGGGDRLQHSVS